MPQGKPRKSLDQIAAETFTGPPRKSLDQIAVDTGAIPAPGILENLGIGARRALLSAADAGRVMEEALGAATKGDFGPLKQIGELVGRGALNIGNALAAGPYQAGPAYVASQVEQAPRIAEIHQEQAARMAQNPELYSREAIAERQRLNARAALDPSLAGKITRGGAELLTGAVPAVVTGIATGGSVPAVAGVTALQSLSEPENLPLNVAASVMPIPIGRALAPIIRRVRGLRSEAVAPVAEAVEGAAGQIRGIGPGEGTSASQIRAMGPVAEEAAIRGERATVSQPPALSAMENPIEVAVARGGSVREALGPGAEESLAMQSGAVVTPAEKSGVQDIITSLRKGGLLRAGTQLRNLGGNAGFQLGEEATRIPESVIDWTLSAITRRRTISGPSLTAMGRSAQAAATEGGRDALQTLKRGATDAEIAAGQLPREINTGWRPFDLYVNGTNRFLNAVDKVFKAGAFQRALEDRATSLAKTEIKQGTIPRGQYGQRVRDLLDNPPTDLLVEVEADSLIAVFQNENWLSKGVARGMAAAQEALGPTGGKWLKFAYDTAFPFVKTPTNMLGRMLEYSALSPKLATSAYRVARGIVQGNMTAAEQRAFAQTYGRASVGVATAILGWKLGEAGYVTGFYEDDPSRRTRDEAAGRPPASIRIGDEWYSVKWLAPLGPLLALGASLQREYNQERAEGQSAVKPMLSVGGKMLLESAPLAEGTVDIAKALSTGNVAETAGKTIGSFAPPGAADIAELLDAQQRRPEGFTQQIQARLPILRENLPPAVDALGQPLPDKSVVDILNTTEDRTAQIPILRELVRLDVGLSKLKKNPKDTEEAYADRVRRFGALYQEYGADLVANAQYQRASDATKKEALESISNRAKAQLNEEEKKMGRGVTPAAVRLNPNIIMSAVIVNSRKKEFKEKVRGR